jgi:hypothetical protein
MVVEAFWAALMARPDTFFATARCLVLTICSLPPVAPAGRV